MLARTDAPLPLPAREWSSLATSSVALNDLGQVAFTGYVTGDLASNWLLVDAGGHSTLRRRVTPDDQTETAFPLDACDAVANPRTSN